MNKQRLLHLGLGAAAVGAAAAISPVAHAGNIVLTGHDDDFHCAEGNFFTTPGISPCAAIKAEATFVVDGSALPILVIDNGTQLSGSLTSAGFSVTKVSVASVTAGMFNHSTYSAFAVASSTDCGGCDNPSNTGTTLAAFSSAIATFFDAGGGILGMTSAGDAGGFNYVPDAASGTAIGHSSGFVATSAGKTGIPGFDAVNGDETHNIFPTFASAYTVAEYDSTQPGNPAVTIFAAGATIICTPGAAGCTITSGGGGSSVPEPASLALLGVGLFGLGVARRRALRASR